MNDHPFPALEALDIPEPLHKKGTRFDGPDGQAYILTRHVFWGDPMSASDFEPQGGAPQPKEGELVPPWLASLLWPRYFN